MKETIIQVGMSFFRLTPKFEISDVSELKGVLDKYDVRLLQRDDESCNSCLDGVQSPIHIKDNK